jgi:hypothetical protein
MEMVMPDSYLYQTIDSFMRFQAGKSTTIPPLPTDKKLLKYYEYAKVFVAEDFVKNIGKYTNGDATHTGDMKNLLKAQLHLRPTHSEDFRGLMFGEPSKIDLYLKYFRSDPSVSVQDKSRLDTNEDGKLEYGRFFGDSYTVSKEEVAGYTKAVAYAEAVERVYSKLSEGKKAVGEDAFVDVEKTKSALVKQHGEEKYKNGGFKHVYGKISKLVGQAPLEEYLSEEKHGNVTITTVMAKPNHEMRFLLSEEAAAKVFAEIYLKYGYGAVTIDLESGGSYSENSPLLQQKPQTKSNTKSKP